ncbi:trafficking protein particle complex subunit 31 [Dermatophagoides farinae]|uniref:Trafficking protein particle complex subunit 5 n=1 Tax=Dermatophagoides farinae TaxID=6954 RepID=A0A922I888_DERFA|nr:trafficking protein particle complex subunit 5-like [Dermatophagoides farinae]KAH7640614.1 trafficking protein particle complex subunit 5-like protein [Dermatophagoides farinae]KAH9526127.1 Trafficking protein particle complex subunit 5 [Dermatophagoides farinae]
MDTTPIFSGKSRSSFLDKSIEKTKSRSDQISLSAFAFLFAELVQYCENRVQLASEMQSKLSEIGYNVGQRIVDMMLIREKNFKRETRLINMLIFIRSKVWPMLFGKEADKLEQANDDKNTYYIIEREPIVNKFISVPKDKKYINCASFIGGIIEAILNECNFPAKITVHWHEGTTFMIKFDDSVIERDQLIEK